MSPSNNPPPYERVVWETDKTNYELITKAIDAFDWDKKISEKYVNDQVSLLDETLLHIISNFVPSKKIIFDDSEPPWFVRKFKNKINIKFTKIPDHKTNDNF